MAASEHTGYGLSFVLKKPDFGGNQALLGPTNNTQERSSFTRFMRITLISLYTIGGASVDWAEEEENPQISQITPIIGLILQSVQSV
jgi:hypothetical protein